MPDRAVYNNVGGVTTKATVASAPNPADPNELIPALRRQCAATFGNINIPEALPEFLLRDPDLETNPLFVSQDLPFPMIVIIAGKPSLASGYAVNDHAVTVPIDFVYIEQEEPDEDNPQDVRYLFEPLITKLLADYRQFAGTDTPSCNDTNLVATPLDRENEYQRKVASLQGKAVCGVLSIECTQIRNAFA